MANSNPHRCQSASSTTSGLRHCQDLYELLSVQLVQSLQRAGPLVLRAELTFTTFSVCTSKVLNINVLTTGFSKQSGQTKIVKSILHQPTLRAGLRLIGPLLTHGKKERKVQSGPFCNAHRKGGPSSDSGLVTLCTFSFNIVNNIQGVYSFCFPVRHTVCLRLLLQHADGANLPALFAGLPYVTSQSCRVKSNSNGKEVAYGEGTEGIGKIDQAREQACS